MMKQRISNFNFRQVYVGDEYFYFVLNSLFFNNILMSKFFLHPSKSQSSNVALTQFDNRNKSSCDGRKLMIVKSIQLSRSNKNNTSKKGLSARKKLIRFNTMRNSQFDDNGHENVARIIDELYCVEQLRNSNSIRECNRMKESMLTKQNHLIRQSLCRTAMLERNFIKNFNEQKKIVQKSKKGLKHREGLKQREERQAKNLNFSDLLRLDTPTSISLPKRPPLFRHKVDHHDLLKNLQKDNLIIKVKSVQIQDRDKTDKIRERSDLIKSIEKQKSRVRGSRSMEEDKYLSPWDFEGREEKYQWNVKKLQAHR